MPRRNQAPGGALHAIINQSSTGAGATQQLGGAFSTFVVQGFCATGAHSTAAKCQLQGCLTTRGWQVIGGATFILSTTTKTKVTKSTNSTPVTNVRVVVKSFSTRAGTTAADTAVVNAWVAAVY